MDEVTLEDILAAQNVILHGIRSELRALRLELQARAGKIEDADREEMLTAQVDADEVSAALSGFTLLTVETDGTAGQA